MKIATFNVNGIRSRLETVLDWLTRNRPDVLCLQETKVQDSEFPAAPIEERGYHVAYSGQKSYNGVAILSLVPADEVRVGLDDGGEPDASRLICARFGALHIVNSYVPQGRALDHPMYAYKLEWFARLESYFGRHFRAREDVVWVGDLNVAPTAMDVHNPDDQKNHVCYHEAVREAYLKAVGWGFEDVFRKHHPEPGHYSFFDYRVRRALEAGLGWRVDHILATRSMAARSTGCEIDLEPRRGVKPSDHTAVLACFKG